MDKPTVVKSHDVHLDAEYTAWIHEVKERYRNTQIKASIKVNSEQLMFYWLLGRDLVIRKAEEKWGSGVVEQVSLDLKNEFPNAKGFGVTNLWYMKRWFLFYSSDNEKLQQLVEETEQGLLESQKRLKQIHDYSADEKLQQLVEEIAFPKLFAFVPWGQHIQIISKCSDIREATFYLKRTVQESWSRTALVNAIDANLYHKMGGAKINCATVLQHNPLYTQFINKNKHKQTTQREVNYYEEN